MKKSLFSPLIHRALEFAAVAHREQVRKGTGTPYISHPMCVAMLLMRAEAVEEVVAAGVLHDIVEDTPVTITEIRKHFGPVVAGMVEAMTERKRGRDGRELPWAQRKDAHFEHLRSASADVKTIALADKLHNLWSSYLDTRRDADVWSRFKAPKEVWLANISRTVDACDGRRKGQHALAVECREVLKKLRGGG